MKILLVDDEQDFVASLGKFIQRLGYELTVANDGRSALDLFYRDPPDIVITDIRMPGMDGIGFIRQIKGVMGHHVDIIVITGFIDAEDAIQSLKYGVRDLLAKPINVRDLADILARCKNELESMRDAESAQADRHKKAGGTFSELHVFSKVMRETLINAELFARDPSLPILIYGETGTGKEHIARYIAGIHGKDKPFVAINCAALPESLVETELFGYEKGTFTGALVSGKKGLFETAQDGTLFLDEIGEMNLTLQSKLLRVLDQKNYCRVGGSAMFELSARIVAATNRNLEEAVHEGCFRGDLLYRINAATIVVPSLRERVEDIVPLAYTFGRDFSREHGVSFVGLSKEVELFFEKFHWPGNVRQLQNTMRLLTLTAQGRKADLADIKTLTSVKASVRSETMRSPHNPFDYSQFVLPEDGFPLEEFVDSIIQHALGMHGGNITKTARYLGLTRRQLQGKHKKFNSRDHAHN